MPPPAQHQETARKLQCIQNCLHEDSRGQTRDSRKLQLVSVLTTSVHPVTGRGLICKNEWLLRMHAARQSAVVTKLSEAPIGKASPFSPAMVRVPLTGEVFSAGYHHHDNYTALQLASFQQLRKELVLASVLGGQRCL